MSIFNTCIRLAVGLIGAVILFHVLRTLIPVSGVLQYIQGVLSKATVSLQQKHDLLLNPAAVDMSLIQPYMPDEDRRKVANAILAAARSRQFS